MGHKYDNNKPSMSLIDPDFLEGLAKVLDFGKGKYGADNWRSGINYSRLISAAYRHLGAINKGENLDDESNLPHVYHLASCIMFLSWLMENRKDLDDRYQKSKKTNSCLTPPEIALARGRAENQRGLGLGLFGGASAGSFADIKTEPYDYR